MTGARRYEPLLKIASGGTAAVYVGTAAGALGFRQLVAIKIPHAHLADDPAFRAALVEEARIAARLHHANVVDVRDVEVDEGGVQLVMDYVEGASLSELVRAWAKEPPPRQAAVAIRIVLDACEGLRALHELTGDDGAPLGLVHRDVSPANVLVGLDGVARIADFGLAKSLLSVERTTSEGVLRGKLGYLAPEYIRGKAIDARIDVFAMGVVLWEALAQRRLFRGENDGDTLERVQRMEAPKLGEVASLGEAAADLDAVLARALAKDPEARFASVAALAEELANVTRARELGATSAEVREAFSPALRAALDDRRRRVQSASSRADGAKASPPPSLPPLAAASLPPPAVASAPPPAAPDASAASVSVASPPSASPASAASVSAAAPASAPAPPRSRSALAFVALGAVAVAVVALAVLAREPAASPAGTPRLLVHETLPLAGEARARAPSAPASSGPPEDAALSTPRGGHAAARPPRPSSEEPGKKPPRPNPYTSPPAPR
jgi:serine/threonine-protein kinase